MATTNSNTDMAAIDDTPKRVGVIFAEGFEEIEAVTIVDVLRRAGIETIAIGLDDRLTVKGAHDIEIRMDRAIDAVTEEELDAVVLPGGMPGAATLAANAAVISLVRKVHDRGNLVGAICAAPIVLKAADLIDDRSVTCYPSFQDQLGTAEYTGERVVVDRNIITGIGPGAALDFSLQLVEYLGLAKTAADLRKTMILA